MKVYEWCYELVVDGDIIDANFSGDILGLSGLETDTLCLILTEGDQIEGGYYRAWAYVKDGMLPEYFYDAFGHEVGYRVPKIYHSELLKHNKENDQRKQ